MHLWLLSAVHHRSVEAITAPWGGLYGSHTTCSSDHAVKLFLLLGRQDVALQRCFASMPDDIFQDQLSRRMLYKLLVQHLLSEMTLPPTFLLRLNMDSPPNLPVPVLGNPALLSDPVSTMPLAMMHSMQLGRSQTYLVVCFCS